MKSSGQGLWIADCRFAASGMTKSRGLLLDALGRRRETEVEAARLERVLVVAQRRIVGRHRHRKARRQPVVEQARTLQLFEARQVAQLLQAEIRQEVLA